MSRDSAGVQVTSLLQLGLMECRRCWPPPRCRGPPRRVQVSRSMALRHQPWRWWHLSQGFATHHREQGLTAVTAPALGAHSALGVAGRYGCTARPGAGISVPTRMQKGMKTECAETAEVFWQGISGVWHLWPAAGPSRHVPQLCPLLPAGPLLSCMLTFRD